jgi:type IV pilus assembly protein PilA
MITSFIQRRKQRMRYAQVLQQRHYHYFNKCVALFAAIFLITSSCAAQAPSPSQPEVTWPQDLQKDPALLTEFGQLLNKIKRDVQFPPPRGQSRLLPLLPESTIIYAAFPNYGDAAHQILTIFQQELQQSPALRAWWKHGDLAANGPKVEDSLEKLYQLSQFLGDEILVSGAMEIRQQPSLLIVAEVRRPGLKDFLQQMAKDLADKSKSPVRVMDVRELATAKDTRPAQELVILVRPDMVIAALDVAALRDFNTRLGSNSREFSATPFGQRVTQDYEAGVTVVGGIDLQKILKQVPPGADQSKTFFQRSGFAHMKYLVWNHKTVAGQAESEMELSFTGPRYGLASWLAAPGPLSSLNFVSSKAVLASGVRLNNPAQIFDDLKDFSTVSNPKAFDTVTQMEAALKLSLKEDLLRHLGGEIAFEVDSLRQPDPEWKVILEVNDPDRVQATLNTLLASTPFRAQQSVEEGVTYHTLRIPSAKKAVEIGYAFVDGYLVIASSQKAVAEAARLHRSGESLAKSPRFLASLPPGHGSEVSALFYEDPSAVAAMTMRQVLPGLESLSQATADTTPVVMCAYAEERAIREISLSPGVDAGGVLIVAAIAIPNLLRARIAANEASAVATIRMANTAQITYFSAYPQRGFARDLATLGPDPAGPNRVSADHANLIDATLGNSSCTAGAWCTKSGFQFSITAVCQKQTCDDFVVVGTPVSSSTGTRSFCSTSDGVVRFKTGPPLTFPVSVSECRTWPTLK